MRCSVPERTFPAEAAARDNLFMAIAPVFRTGPLKNWIAKRAIGAPRLRPVGWRRAFVAFLIAAGTSCGTPAQVLAHPGWTRANHAGEPWYQRAVFYQVRNAAPDFKALAARIDAMQAAGMDAVIVTPPALPSLAGASTEQAIAAQAALDDFDTFTRQATAHGIRVVVTLSAAHADAELAGRIRFWLTRGVAGVRLEFAPDASPQDQAAIAVSARAVVASVGGNRVLLLDEDPSAHRSRTAPKTAHEPGGIPVLEVVKLAGPLTAAALRPQLANLLVMQGAVLDTSAGEDATESGSLAKALATIALASGGAALADPQQPLAFPKTEPLPEPTDDSAKSASPPPPVQPPPGVYLPYVPYVPPPRTQNKAAPPPPPPADPLTLWYAKLSALHHTNAALRTGAKIILDFDSKDVLVWVARPAKPTAQNPPVVVLCNLSGAPAEISIADAIRKLNLHGFFLRTLARSDDAMGAQDLESVKLAAYGVFIGELRR